jgi:transcriptional regulator with XRE-family HTH domain
MSWLDDERKRAGYNSEYALATAANISHTTVSGWRTGRQLPTTKTLTAVAEVLNLDPRHLWVRAGLMTAEEVGMDDSAPAALSDADEATRELIRNSTELDETAKAELLRMLDEQARDDAARRHSMFARLVAAERTVKA